MKEDEQKKRGIDLPVKEATATNQNFLDLLRASTRGNYEESNDDTLRARNGQRQGQGSGPGHHQVPSTLSDLFDPPPPMHSTPTMSIEERSIGTLTPELPGLQQPHLPATLPPRFPARPTPIHSRDRSVSFGTDTKFTPSSDNLHNQTNPSEDLANTAKVMNVARTHNKCPSMGGHAMTINLGQLGRHNAAARKLTIDDLLGAGKYETEAESNILKALEEQQHQQQEASRQRLTSETSTILTGVPDSLAHDFSTEDERKKDSDGSTLHNEGSHQENDDDENTASSRSSFKKQQSRPLLSRDHNRRPNRGHRKSMSVEDRLAGLTIAMWNMDDHKKSLPESPKSPKRNEVPVSSVEQFGHDAMLVASHNDMDIPVSPRSRRGTVDLSGLPTGLPVVDENEESSDEADRSSSTTDIEDQRSSRLASDGLENETGRRREKRHGRRSSMFARSADRLKDDWDIWQTFFRPRKDELLKYIRKVLFYMFIPLIGVAVLLFYFLENPITGMSEDGSPEETASISWWLLFVVRQTVTLSMALSVQAVMIDFLCIRTKTMLRFFGPLLTLLIVQSKGWPFVVFSWSIFDFGLLFGKHAFARHWGYFQDVVGLFNDENPSGHVVDSEWNRRILLIGVTVSISVALKRFAVGLLLGRQTFHHYGEQLAIVLNKMVLIGEVAMLGKRIYKTQSSMSQGMPEAAAGLGRELQAIKVLAISFDEDEDEDDDDDDESATSTLKSVGTEKLIDTAKRDPLTGSLLPSEKAKLMQLVDRWEEPDRHSSKFKNNISISSVLKFRNALTFIRNEYPFGYAFGLGYSRESCIDSAQELYNKLLIVNNNDERVVNFETLALIALTAEGTVDQGKAKELVKVFRPDRDGCLTVLDFVKSVDAVYKEFRLLQASIENSSQIDRAFENILNIFFYILVTTIILSMLGFDPLSLFLSLSSVILVFAFMIGSASSKYFEGLLFILVRRPYGIGDLIHVSNIEQDTKLDGSIGWVVQHVSLFETTMTWLPTNETASVSNGSLASSRVINWARSPNTRFVVFFILPIETKYEALELFKRAVEEYLKVRPREWLAFNAFRVMGIFADKGYMKVEVVVQHRDSWQNIGQVMDSRGNLVSFCHEVQKILGMQYRAPPLPIDFLGGHIEDGMLSIGRKEDQEKEDNNAVENSESDAESKTDLFRSVARDRHHIRLS